MDQRKIVVDKPYSVVATITFNESNHIDWSSGLFVKKTYKLEDLYFPMKKNQCPFPLKAL